jgi:uncharacterized membrane protein YgdD (TMEM256/DUF423 family)
LPTILCHYSQFYPMHKKFLIAASLLGALSVAMGAFAAHRLKQIFSAEVLQVFETAVRYQFLHVFALLGTGILFQYFPGKLLLWAGWLFIAGIVLFSGSLYALCCVKHMQLQNKLWVGAITPLGGLCFIAGWLLLATAVAQKS